MTTMKGTAMTTTSLGHHLAADADQQAYCLRCGSDGIDLTKPCPNEQASRQAHPSKRATS